MDHRGSAVWQSPDRHTLSAEGRLCRTKLFTVTVRRKSNVCGMNHRQGGFGRPALRSVTGSGDPAATWLL